MFGPVPFSGPAETPGFNKRSRLARAPWPHLMSTSGSLPLALVQNRGAKLLSTSRSRRCFISYAVRWEVVHKVGAGPRNPSRNPERRPTDRMVGVSLPAAADFPHQSYGPGSVPTGRDKPNLQDPRYPE